MNGITHFLTGYLVGRTFKYKNTRFESFFVAICALVPDVDMIINAIPGIDFEHGVFTHTLIGGTLFALMAAGIAIGLIYLISPGFFQRDVEPKLTIPRIIFLSFIGMLSHQIVDMGTYHYGPADDTHHVLFWPFWDFAFHIDDIFPGPRDLMWNIRVLVEVVYTIVIAAYILFYQWAKKKENPFYMMSPWHWTGSPKADLAWVKALAIIFGVIAIGLSEIILGIFLLSIISIVFLGIIYAIDRRRKDESMDE